VQAVQKIDLLCVEIIRSHIDPGRIAEVSSDVNPSGEGACH
jgi:hypothetical protein